MNKKKAEKLTQELLDRVSNPDYSETVDFTIPEVSAAQAEQARIEHRNRKLQEIEQMMKRLGWGL